MVKYVADFMFPVKVKTTASVVVKKTLRSVLKRIKPTVEETNNTCSNHLS